MRNFPKVLATEQDVQNCLEMYPEETRNYLKPIRDNIMAWFATGELAVGAKGVTDGKSKIVTEKNEKSEIVSKLQMKLKIDPTSKLFRMGLTVKKVDTILSGGKQI